jgi:hypothetical protein
LPAQTSGPRTPLALLDAAFAAGPASYGVPLGICLVRATRPDVGQSLWITDPDHGSAGLEATCLAGPGRDALQNDMAVYIPDVSRSRHTWPDAMAAAGRKDVASMLVLPLPTAGEALLLILCSPAVDAFAGELLAEAYGFADSAARSVGPRWSASEE